METEPSGWAVGWTVFAATMLGIGGMFQIIAGVAAIAGDELYVVGREWVFSFDITTWGWIHLGLGIVLLLVGAGLVTGNVVARTIGVIVAALSAVASFAFLPWYPVWAIVLIAIDITVIWAITAHGRDTSVVLNG